MRNSVELFKKAQNGDNDALTELFEQNRPLVSLELRKEKSYGNTSSFDLDDLEQELNIALIKAIKRFDTDKEYTFGTFASNYLKNTRHTVREMNKTNKLCRSDFGIYVQMKKLRKEENITEDEAYDKLNVSIEIRERIRCINSGFLSMQYESNSNDNEETMRLEDTLVCESDDYEELERDMMIKKMLNSLPDRYRQVIYMQFYKGMTQREIGYKLGVSQTYVSRIVRKSLIKMKKSYYCQ